MIRAENRGKIQVVLAALLVVHGLITTSFWSRVSAALSSDGATYEQRRAIRAFRGVPVDDLAARIDANLAPGDRLALGDGLKRDTFLKQRLTEGLYPRVIDKTASSVLDLVDGNSFTPGPAIELLRFPQTGSPWANRVMILKPQPSGQPATPATRPDFSFSFLGFLAVTVAMFGFGLGALWVARATLEPALAVPAAILGGATVNGLVFSLATWLGFSVPRIATISVGIVLAIGLGMKRFARQNWTGMRSMLEFPENGVFALLFLLFFVCVVELPVSWWDGRSIWFFHAKQLFLNGTFTRQDLMHPDAQWSHTHYPVLLPGWFAQFSALSSGYNERMASLGIPVLFGAVLALTWRLARAQAGRWAGAALSTSLFLSLSQMTAGGYADGFVTTMLLLQFLALMSPDPGHRKIGWMAAIAVSLIKQEGLVFSGMITLGFLLLTRERRPWALLCYLPALIHQIFVKSLGLKGVFDELRIGDALEDAAYRIGVIWDGAWALLSRYPLLWEGMLAGLASAVLWLFLRKESEAGAGKASALLGVATLSFSCAVLFITPLDIRWHVRTALDRLMLHSAAFFLLATFLFLKPGRHASPEGEVHRHP